MMILLLLFFQLSNQCYVTKVIDGDTFKCTQNGEKLTVRMLAIDTPEITRGKNECYGQEAKKYLSDRILHRDVTLEYDNGKTYGYFGRLLAYVILNKEMLNEAMLRLGYAKTTVKKYSTKRYPPPYFLALEDHARFFKFGLWGKCKTGGK